MKSQLKIDLNDSFDPCLAQVQSKPNNKPPVSQIHGRTWLNPSKVGLRDFLLNDA